MARPIHDFIGRRFGRLTVVEFAGYKEYRDRRRPLFRCRCACGAEVVRDYGPLHSGTARSCGCLTIELRTKHGESGTQLYAVWCAMRDRCRNPKDARYKWYGARGIKVCDRWNDYVTFRDDMGPRPEGASLERLDRKGHYEPGNVRWASDREQANNKCTNHFVTLGGETRTIAEWARHAGVNEMRLRSRIEAGWPLAEALTKGWSRGERRDLKRTAVNGPAEPR